jgi:RNA polymerase sigma-70 factor (ECF subfamily)
MARGSGLAHHEAEDAVQEIVLCVARKIECFQPGPELGSFKGWLGQLVRWRIVDLMRRRPKEIRSADLGRRASDVAADTSTSLLARVPNPAGGAFERQWDAEYAQALIDAALERVKRRVNPKHYQIYHLHVVEGRTADHVAQAFGVKVDQVYLIKNRVNSALRRERASIEKSSGLD